MKKILTILCIVLSFAAAAQPGYTRFNTRGNWLAVGADAFNLPGLGTPALATAQIPRAGALIYDSTGGNRGVHVWTGAGWVKIYDTLMSISASNTLQQVINNGPTISTNSTIPLAANLFIGDNIGIEFKNSTSVLELYGATIKLNRGWSGAAGTLGLAAGTSTDSVVTINQATGQLKMRNASSFGGGGSVGTASNGITLTGSNYKLGGSMADLTTTLSFHGINSIVYDSVRQFNVKTGTVTRIDIARDGNTVLRDSSGANYISIGTASTGIISNGAVNITAKGPSSINLTDSINIKPLAGDLRIYPLNHNYSPALTVATYDTTNGRVYHTPISALAGSADSSIFATQFDLSTGSVYCPVYLDTIQDKTVINGATNTKDNSFPYVERTNTGKLVYGVYKGRVHGAGGLNQYATSTNNGVTISAFTDGQTDTMYNWRNLIPSRLRGDTIGVTEVSGTNGRVYIRHSTDDFVTFSARDSIQISGVTWLFSEGKVVVFNGFNVMPVYSYSPDVDKAGIAYKSAFTGGTWQVLWLSNGTSLQLNEIVLVIDDDTLFLFARSELNTGTMYRAYTTDLVTLSAASAVTNPEYYAGKPDVIKMPDGRYLGNFRSREGSPVTPDEGIISISNDKGLTWTLLRELRQEYYTYGNLLHMGDNTYLLAYATQIPVPYASMYQLFFVVPSCDLNTNADQKVYEKYGAPFNILKDYIDRKAGLTIALTDGSVPFANTLGTGLSEDNTRFYWNNSTKTLSLGLNTAIGRLNVKAIGSNSGHGIAVIEDNSGANTGMNHESGVFTISPATDAAPTTYVARLKLYEPTATGSDPVVELGTAHFIGLQDGTVKIAKPFTQSGAGLFRIEGTGSVPGTGATGVGGEMFVAGGAFYIAPYNRSTSANAPLNLGGASVNISGIALNVGQVNVSAGNRINFGGNAGDLSSAVNGDVFYNSTTNKLRGRENGAWVDLGNAGTVTSVATGLGLSGGTITGAGTIIADTSYLVNKTTAQVISGAKNFTADILVPAEVYGSGWNGSNEAPTKNDLYDKIETIAGSVGGVLYYQYPLYEVNDSTLGVDTGAGRSSVKTYLTTRHLVDSLVTAKPTPTLQQVLTAGSTLTSDNTIDAGTNDLFFNVESGGIVGLGNLDIGPSIAITPSTNDIQISGDIILAVGGQELEFSGLTNATTQNRIIGQTSGTSKVGYITIGSGLSLASGVLTASGGGSGTVTDLSFTGGLISVATSTTTPALTVAGTSGGVPYFSSATTWASSAALTSNSIVLGGGAGAAPKVAAGFTTDGTSILTLGVAGTSVGTVAFKNATSGTASLLPPTGALGTYNVTLPNAASTLPIFGQQITFAGPTAARTVTFPDANFTVARTNSTNTFTGTQTFGTAILTDVISATSQFANSASAGPFAYRTTNGGGDVQPSTLFAGAGVNTAGALAYGFNAAAGVFFSAGNGTRQILRAAIQIGDLVNTAGSEAASLNFYTQSAGAAAALAMTIKANTGITFPITITAGGTTGAQTINKTTGTVNFAAAATTLVVTNSLVTTSSIVYCVVRTADATAGIKSVVPAAGSFTITLSAAATAETSVGFWVIN